MRICTRLLCRFALVVAVDQWAGEALVNRLPVHFASTANGIRPPGFAAWIAASVHSRHAGNLAPVGIVPCADPGLAPMVRNFAPLVKPGQSFP